ncbi:MAG TPA: HemK2/MTQ2 family protein methyltransferase [archaeon]|nr:HemK2/MTQ2 family protein methyltransferase [archaeon]
MNGTFFFSGKEFPCPQNVYCPSDDSYFLAEHVKVKPGQSVIDLGCGSGIQTLNALLAQNASHVLALDINKDALSATLQNCKIAGVEAKVQTRESDLFSNCEQKADVIIFNPPYVATEQVKYKDLDGGKRGREVLDKFLEQFPLHLNKNGKCFFLQTDINGYKKTEKILTQKGIKFEILAKKRIFFEELAICCCRM